MAYLPLIVYFVTIDDRVKLPLNLHQHEREYRILDHQILLYLNKVQTDTISSISKNKASSSLKKLEIILFRTLRFH